MCPFAWGRPVAGGWLIKPGRRRSTNCHLFILKFPSRAPFHPQLEIPATACRVGAETTGPGAMGGRKSASGEPAHPARSCTSSRRLLAAGTGLPLQTSRQRLCKQAPCPKERQPSADLHPGTKSPQRQSTLRQITGKGSHGHLRNPGKFLQSWIPVGR